MMEKLTQWIEHVVAILGLVSVVCGLLAKVVPDGKAKRVFRDLGMRAGDAVRVLQPGPKSEPKVQVKP